MTVHGVQKKLVLLVAAACMGGLFLAGCAPEAPSATSMTTMGANVNASVPADQVATPIPSEKPAAGIEGDPDNPAMDDQRPVEPGPTAAVEFINAVFTTANSTVSAVAMVSNMVSSTGVCKITVSQGESSFGTEVNAEADAQVTYCSNMNVAIPTGSTGEWKILVEFSDQKYSGKAVTTIVI